MAWTWETDSSGLVRVNGIILVPDAAMSAMVDSKIIAPYKDLILRASAETGAPAGWIAGIAASESYPMGNARSISRTKSGDPIAYGLTQILPSVFAQYNGRAMSEEEMLDPWNSLRTTGLILQRYRQHGMDLPTTASAYNAGPKTSSGSTWTAKRCDQGYPCVDASWGLYAEGNYITSVVGRANHAMLALGASSGGSTLLKVGSAVLAAGAAWFLAKRYLPL